MISTIISRLVILLFGTLYPAYASYKAVKTKNIREYVKWMMYWIVFAIFTAAETFADVFISWIPFYYELKIVFVFWLLSPATRGSSILYRNFVHPRLVKYEPEIDRAITTATEKGYTGLVEVSARGLEIFKSAVITAAIKGQTTLATHISNAERSRSVSLTDMRGVGANGDQGLDDFEPLGQDLVNGNGTVQAETRRTTRSRRQVAIARSSSNIQLTGQCSEDHPNESPLFSSSCSSNDSCPSPTTAPQQPLMTSMLNPTTFLASNLGLGTSMKSAHVERVALWLANKSTPPNSNKRLSSHSSFDLPQVTEDELAEGYAANHDSANIDDNKHGVTADQSRPNDAPLLMEP